jgi:photosystem II stability/assembly factor-like uncharacterized protein
MRKIYTYLIIAVMSGSACKMAVHLPNASENLPAPEFMEFEKMRTQNPETGRINPGDLVKAWQSLDASFGRSDKQLKREIYPYGWTAVDDYMATLSISKIVHDPLQPKTFYFCTGEGWFNADAARGWGVWKSTDAGASWNVLPSTLNDSFWHCQDMIVHPITGHIYVATREAGLQRSTDGGLTWKMVLGTNNGAIVNRMGDLELTADHGIFVTAGLFQTDGIYYSSTGDPGTWEKRVTGIPSDIHRIEMATAPSDANVAYCIPVSSNTDRKIRGVYKTKDKGLTWEEVSLPGGDRELAKQQGWYDLIITVDPNNPDVAVAGGLNIWRTRDGGKNWEQLTEGDTRSKVKKQYVHVDQHEVVFINSDTVLFGNDGGIYMCTNFTSDDPILFDVNKNYNVTQYYSCAIGPEVGDYRVLGGTQDNGTYMSSGLGISDFNKLSWADGGFCAVNPNGQVIFTTTQERRIYRFRGTVTDTITNPKVKDANVLFINPLEMDATDPEVIYQASNQGLWRLDNASFADSTDWRLTTRPWGQISAIASSKAKPNTVFLGRTNGGKVYRVDNAHLTDNNYFPVNLDLKGILPIGGDEGIYTSCIALSQQDANHAVVVYSNYGVPSVFESRNTLADSADWVNVEGNLPDMPIRWAMIHPDNEDVCYVATELGIYYTEKLDGSNTLWKPAGTGLPNLRIDMIRYRESDKTFIIGTHGRGLFTAVNKPGSYEFEYTERGPRNIGGRTRTFLVDPNDPSGKKIWAGSVSGGLWVTGNIDSAAYFYYAQPSAFSAVLYPNPAVNGRSGLKIEVEKAQQIAVKVFDLNGRWVKDVFDGWVKDTWEGTLDFSGLAGEMYIIQVSSSAAAASKPLHKKSFKVLVR